MSTRCRTNDRGSQPLIMTPPCVVAAIRPPLVAAVEAKAKIRPPVVAVGCVVAVGGGVAGVGRRAIAVIRPIAIAVIAWSIAVIRWMSVAVTAVVWSAFVLGGVSVRNRRECYRRRRWRRSHQAAQGNSGRKSDSEKFHGQLPNSCCMLSEQMARCYLNRARRRTVSSPHPCKVPASQHVVSCERLGL